MRRIVLLVFGFVCIVKIAIGEKPYFQQRVDYKISVSLDDKKNFLSGFEELIYRNNSQDTLRELFFHLWPNAYKYRSSALCYQLVSKGNMSLYFANDEQRGFIDSLNFRVDDKVVSLVYDSINIDICKIVLNKPLLPNDTILITTPFRIKIPDAKFSRLGHVGQSYMISQWYPKPAVYDKDGWHTMPYLSQGEFYSEFGSFLVDITVPANYVVAASGYLKTPSEVEFINKKIKTESNQINFDKQNTFPESESSSKSIRFALDSVHDFAWFADKRFRIVSKVIKLASGHEVECRAYYTPANSYVWHRAADYVAEAVLFYSKYVGEYPYGVCTAVDGTIAAGGGMEYPTITVIGSTGNSMVLNQSIAHEVGHNWFYGILASNERKLPWMDEGINSFYEQLYMIQYYARESAAAYQLTGVPLKIAKTFGADKMSFAGFNKISYLLTARTNDDQSSGLTSEYFSNLNYGADIYSKIPLCFSQLRDFLGHEKYDSCMQTYFNTWKFRHPDEAAIQNVFETTSGKSLGWFFNGMIDSNSKSDAKICKVNTDSGGTDVLLKNRGNLAMPVNVSFYNKEKLIASQWTGVFDGKFKLSSSVSGADKIVLDTYDQSLDLNPFNNSMKTKGVFRKWKPLQLRFLTMLENPERTQLFYLPAVAYNNYNGWMAGVILHNYSLLSKKFEFGIVPMYAFKSKSVAGVATASYQFNIYNGWFDRIIAKISPTLFDEGLSENRSIFKGYFSVPASLSFRIRKSQYKPYSEKYVNIIHHYINQTFSTQNNSSATNEINITQLEFASFNYSKTDPGSLSFILEKGGHYAKLTGTWKKEITLTRRKKDLSLRFFAGTFLDNSDYGGEANFRSSAWRGTDDYSYSGLWFGRNEYDGFWAHQMQRADGAMAAYYPVRTDHWLAALNVSVKTPVSGLRLFADGITFYNANKVSPGATVVRYDAGIMLSIVHDAFEIYWPLIVSKEVRDYYDLNDIKLADRIRFVFNINKLNPVLLRKMR
ncbi:MAG TPA: M1 family metallopeptidase [Bacteroidia bacterium]|nr:M1 family metallopeptidase [Bacteroidia bacterium]